MRYRRKWRPAKRVTLRRKRLKRYGAKCFLVPSKTKPKYPVCNPRGQVTCQGLWAAWSRAGSQRANLVRRKALRRAKAKGCPWARGK
jgi:hypothetical protein